MKSEKIELKIKDKVVGQLKGLASKVEAVARKNWPVASAPTQAEPPERDASAAGLRTQSTEPTFEGVDERISKTRFRVDSRAHITVNNAVCKDCSTQACVYACPANLFTPLSDGTILFNYEQCFECGTCYVACNREGAITWTYPRGGFGVSFREA